MVYIVSKAGMKKGMWSIENFAAPGFSPKIMSGLTSKKAAEKIAKMYNQGLI